MPSAQSDERAILAVHKDWWEANSGLDIPRMARCFPEGMNYLMFNLNGHPYFGLEEKVELWRYYQKQLDIDMPDIRIMKFEMDRDMAWMGCEGIFPLRIIGDTGSGSSTWETTEASTVGYRVRSTEVYRRDDGNGKPQWRMWHFHCSPMPPDDEPRPGLGGTRQERGLGWNPWGEPRVVVGR